MKLNLIDARGRSCPEPVLMTKKAIELNPEGIEVLVDNTTARDNIKRFGNNLGYNIEIAEKDEDFVLTLKK
ncbi:sulfurtransferase TusA family protein [Sporosalibacterium faouarense]|uniref:sulfurtransferase TusA family protein n=1 Tax=Sporosalibacterium faouarense TaxID=516123 RepID=UPI00141CF9C6|nr:sulfurtransferase TusA family protein [Sporosalibacterium faouarense]MTI47215.1 preprotein translocase subunit TatB [Bacillota bacterium]